MAKIYTLHQKMKYNEGLGIPIQYFPLEIFLMIILWIFYMIMDMKDIRLIVIIMLCSISLGLYILII